jgi:hypothetical protein
MDAFWYDPDGGYRQWRKPHWPNGPERWLAACRQNGVKPGLWVSTNSLCHLNPSPAWEDSLNRERTAMCMFDGGFLSDFMRVLQHWYDCGVGMFKFDFARFGAATVDAERAHLPHEICALNNAALSTALLKFRQRNPEVRLLAYNGFGGIQDNTSRPFRKTVDVRLLDVFDSLYCGDPRPADVPAMNFWRAQDVYSDHVVRQYERNEIPLGRIDNSAFMIGKTAACYHRKTSAWKGMLVLSLARGGLINTYYGNLELLDAEKATWFAKTQALFLQLQARGRFFSFGGISGEGVPYGYVAVCDRGALYTVVNPSQRFEKVQLKPVSGWQPSLNNGRVLFRDAGYQPELSGDSVKLGPEQMCVVGCGVYSDGAYDLGVEEDIVVPAAIEPLAAVFETCGHNEIGVTITPPRGADVRIVMRQSDNGVAYRSAGASSPPGRYASEVLRISAQQAGAEIPVRIQNDKIIWSGLSWVVGEIKQERVKPGTPVRIVCSSTEDKKLELGGSVYKVVYAERT